MRSRIVVCAVSVWVAWGSSMASEARAQVLSGSLVYVAIQPCRVVDTRFTGVGHNVHAPLLHGTAQTFRVVGANAAIFNQGGTSTTCSLPGFIGATAQAGAAVFDLIAVGPAGAGDLRAWPSDRTKPLASVLNYGTTTIANGIVIPLGQTTEGQDLTVLAEAADTDLVVDVVGYFTGVGSPSGITAVNAGTGLSGGGTSGGVTLNAAVPFALGAGGPGGAAGAKLVAPGIGSLGATGVQGWGDTGVYAYGLSSGLYAETPFGSGTAAVGNAYGGGTGVLGYTVGSGVGVQGQSTTNGIGVYGVSVSGYAMRGVSTSSNGVRGESNSDIGVAGVSNTYLGVYGSSSGNSGVVGRSTSTAFGHTAGVYGIGLGGSANSSVTSTPVGVWGDSYSTTGIIATSHDGEGLYAESQSPTTGAAVFMNGGGGPALVVSTGGCDGCAASPAADRTLDPNHYGRLAVTPPGALIATSSGAFLSRGGNWVNSSDVRVKENFRNVDARELFGEIAALPIRSWNYIADGPDARHIGPTAQDFQAAFHLGGSDTTISTIDPAGIALAAVQELIHRSEAQQQTLDQQRRRIEDLERRLAAFQPSARP